MGKKGYKLVRGIGVNDADYDVVAFAYREDGSRYKCWECPFYRDWTNMLTRCTSEEGKYSYEYSPNHNSQYLKCSCDPDWLYFSKFRAWAVTQDWVGNHLDKDLIGDGTHYSPDTCVYIPPIINTSLTRSGGSLSFGVGFVSNLKRPYKSSVKCLGKLIRKTRFFATELDAHKYWIEGKIEALNSLIEEYQHLTDKRILDGLRAKMSKLQHAYDNDILLYKL